MRLFPGMQPANLECYARRSAHRSRRARAQPPQHRRHDPPRPADRHHRPVRLGQILARLRHHLRRRPAPLRRVAVRVCAPVPRPHGEARRRLDRRAVARDLDRAEDRRAQSALDGRHGHGDLRLSAPALRARRNSALPQLRPSRAATERRRRSPTPCSPGPRERRSRFSRRSCGAARASSASCSRAARKQGFIRAYVDGELVEVADPPKLNRKLNHSISVVVDRLVVRAEDRGRLTDSVETALKLAEGLVEVVRQDDNSRHLFSERVRLSGLRHLAARARAAPLLVQLAVRRVPGVRRPRHAARSQRGAHPRRPEHLDPRGRRAAVGRARRLSAQGHSSRAREAVRVRPQRAVGRAVRSRRATSCSYGSTGKQIVRQE